MDRTWQFILAIVAALILAKFMISFMFWQRNLPIGVAPKERPSIYCFVMTTQMNHQTKVPVLMETWLPRCDYFEFHSDGPLPPQYPHEVLHTFRSIKETWRKLRYSIKHINNTAMNYDWYVRSCDDSYFVIENLRAFLADKNPDEHHYYGMEIRWPNITFIAGSGIVFSRATMQLLATKLLDSGRPECKEETTSTDDVNIARCLKTEGILPEATEDARGRMRFHHEHFSYIFYENGGRLWFSRSAILFHRLNPIEIRLFEMLLYNVSVNHSFSTRT